MSDRPRNALVIVVLLGLGFVAHAADERPQGRAESKKKILVELYTSQGCDSCPPASQLLGELAQMGYGPDQIVPIGFHVDYFNDPWKDPYSDEAFSRRQLEYNEVLKRDDLYFTPMLMVDGSMPMLGSDRGKVLQALKRARAAPAAVRLETSLVDQRGGKELSVELSDPATNIVGRDLIVGVAVTQSPITTYVRSGENAGKRLTEHFVARSFTVQTTRVNRTGPVKLTFPLRLRPGQNKADARVAVFVQDQNRGNIYQSDSVPWSPSEKRVSARSK